MKVTAKDLQQTVADLAKEKDLQRQLEQNLVSGQRRTASLIPQRAEPIKDPMMEMLTMGETKPVKEMSEQEKRQIKAEWDRRFL